MNDLDYDMSHPMPLLGNSQPLVVTGGRYIAQIGVGNGNGSRIAEWLTKEAEAQELELLLFPLSLSEGAPVVDASITVKLRFVLNLAVGASGGSGSAYDTMLSMPMNGLRYRFRAKAANLSVYGEGIGTVNVALFASIYPVCCDTDAIVSMDTTSTGLYQPIPKGARAYRLSRGISETTGAVIFQDMAGNTLATVTSAPDWTDIPRGAYAFQSATTWTPGPERINFGSTVYFRN